MFAQSAFPLEAQVVHSFQIAAVSIGAAAILPVLVLCCTCFPFFIIVFSICRQSIGLQQSPPNVLLIFLCIFLTYFVMSPVLEEAWSNGVIPFINGQSSFGDSLKLISEPFIDFMRNNVDEQDLILLSDAKSGLEWRSSGNEVSVDILLPSFLLGQVSHAFAVGFFVVLPFLVIDLVTAAVLMSMGMMMVPPAVVSLPFKIAFFSVANGWIYLAAASVSFYK
ncbi:flagellar type III secretion system pore protein FliP [Mangrovicoccus ximenensis]|uniref:flagellar type III secretion system pore protein FliP n=1 Tax=Mangrovicoccus ximenensis TaxID=1911570 RepID=UPI000D352D12|nr:flagellar type III secretion system pore protein FliP [Mangrovicoccus ximenensis]